MGSAKSQTEAEQLKSDEEFALRCLRLGNGQHKVSHDRFSEVYVAWWAENDRRVNVYLQKGRGKDEARVVQFEVNKASWVRQETY